MPSNNNRNGNSKDNSNSRMNVPGAVASPTTPDGIPLTLSTGDKPITVAKPIRNYVSSTTTSKAQAPTPPSSVTIGNNSDNSGQSSTSSAKSGQLDTSGLSAEDGMELDLSQPISNGNSIKGGTSSSVGVGAAGAGSGLVNLPPNLEDIGLDDDDEPSPLSAAAPAPTAAATGNAGLGVGGSSSAASSASSSSAAAAASSTTSNSSAVSDATASAGSPSVADPVAVSYATSTVTSSPDSTDQGGASYIVSSMGPKIRRNSVNRATAKGGSTSVSTGKNKRKEKRTENQHLTHFEDSSSQGVGGGAAGGNGNGAASPTNSSSSGQGGSGFISSAGGKGNGNEAASSVSAASNSQGGGGSIPQAPSIGVSGQGVGGLPAVASAVVSASVGGDVVSNGVGQGVGSQGLLQNSSLNDNGKDYVVSFNNRATILRGSNNSNQVIAFNVDYDAIKNSSDFSLLWQGSKLGDDDMFVIKKFSLSENIQMDKGHSIERSQAKKGYKDIWKSNSDDFIKAGFPPLKDGFPELPIIKNDKGENQGYKNVAGIAINGKDVKISILDGGEEGIDSVFNIQPVDPNTRKPIGYKIQIVYKDNVVTKKIVNAKTGKALSDNEIDGLSDLESELLDSFNIDISRVNYNSKSKNFSEVKNSKTSNHDKSHKDSLKEPLSETGLNRTESSRNNSNVVGDANNNKGNPTPPSITTGEANEEEIIPQAGGGYHQKKHRPYGSQASGAKGWANSLANQDQQKGSGGVGRGGEGKPSARRKRYDPIQTRVRDIQDSDITGENTNL